MGTPRRSAAGIVLGAVLAACAGAAESPPAAEPTGITNGSPLATASPQAGTQQPPTAGTTTTPAPSPVAEWSAIAFDRPERPAELRAITRVGDRLVAVGSSAHAGAAWLLDPGGEWTRATDVPAPPGGREVLILTGVAAGANGLVAVGLLGALQSEFFDTVLWSSADGESWTETQRIQGVLLGSVAAGEAGYVAVGSGAGVATPGAIEVWRSADGASWTEADVEALGTGNMISIIPYDGGFLAVGAAQGADASGIRTPALGAAWTSPDGVTWSEAWRETTENTFLLDVVATDTGLLAVGTAFRPAEDPSGTGGSIPTAWRSSDGTTWEATPFAAQSADARGVTAGESGFVAVGGIADDPRQQPLAVWTSADGTTWALVEQVAQEPAGSLSDVLSLADRVVAVGALNGDDPDGQTRQPVVVVGPPP